MLKRFCPRRADSPPRTGHQLERVQQLKVNIRRREELEAHAETLKKRLVDKGFGLKPPAAKPPPLQNPRSSTATPRTLPNTARATASAAPPKEKRRRKDEWPGSDQEEETAPADDSLKKICEDMIKNKSEMQCSRWHNKLSQFFVQDKVSSMRCKFMVLQRRYLKI